MPKDRSFSAELVAAVGAPLPAPLWPSSTADFSPGSKGLGPAAALPEVGGPAVAAVLPPLPPPPPLAALLLLLLLLVGAGAAAALLLVLLA